MWRSHKGTCKNGAVQTGCRLGLSCSLSFPLFLSIGGHDGTISVYIQGLWDGPQKQVSDYICIVSVSSIKTQSEIKLSLLYT